MEIEFNPENIEKCLCSDCKVHNKSTCIKNNDIMLQEKALSSSLIEPEDFPALYCGTGREHCSDLDGHQECLCENCPIYSENDMITGSPQSYFCLNGSSTRCYLAGTNEEDIIRVNDMLRHYYLRRD